jgi:hypothetical protein
MRLEVTGMSGPGTSAPDLPTVHSVSSTLPVRTLTRGPRHHWFGYYDKLQTDPTGRWALGMAVEFEHRSPRAGDRISVGMIDLWNADEWIELGHSTAWCWQQGCMLQWVPGSSDTVVWNDREADGYVCRILNVFSRALRTIPSPVYALSPDGRTAVTTEFRRLGDTRPGYGYTGLPDPEADVLRPKRSGIARVDLLTGASELLFSVAEVAAFGPQLPSMAGVKHWFNHLLFNPDGSRFVFLHRWQVGRSRETRMLTSTPDGRELRVVDANGLTSHFIWRDPRHLLAWSHRPEHGKAFYLFEDGEGSPRPVGLGTMSEDGHCTYMPGAAWILCDTYPDAARMQRPYLYHPETGRRIELDAFYTPPEYTGEWRCDLHPRATPDGRSVLIDSPHTGAGRQIHLIDLSSAPTA